MRLPSFPLQLALVAGLVAHRKLAHRSVRYRITGSSLTWRRHCGARGSVEAARPARKAARPSARVDSVKPPAGGPAGSADARRPAIWPNWNSDRAAPQQGEVEAQLQRQGGRHQRRAGGGRRRAVRLEAAIGDERRAAPRTAASGTSITPAAARWPSISAGQHQDHDGALAAVEDDDGAGQPGDDGDQHHVQHQQVMARVDRARAEPLGAEQGQQGRQADGEQDQRRPKRGRWRRRWPRAAAAGAAATASGWAGGSCRTGTARSRARPAGRAPAPRTCFSQLSCGTIDHAVDEQLQAAGGRRRR